MMNFGVEERKKKKEIKIPRKYYSVSAQRRSKLKQLHNKGNTDMLVTEQRNHNIPNILISISVKPLSSSGYILIYI
jgi:hypothetical protein